MIEQSESKLNSTILHFPGKKTLTVKGAVGIVGTGAVTVGKVKSGMLSRDRGGEVEEEERVPPRRDEEEAVPCE